MNNFDKMIITPLGTVSPYCKGDKNCPGFLIESGGKKVLLDCGCGISRLLNMKEDLNDLIIIISHLHKDHYGDLLSIGYASYVYKNLGYITGRVRVYIPSGDMVEMRESYIGSDGWGENRIIEKPIIDFQYLMNFGEEHYLEFIDYTESLQIKHGNMNITFRRNPHPITTYSIKVTDKENTIVYSSDTGYSGNTLVDFANNVDMLICEASFLKGQLRKEDNHLFAYEAGMIAKKSKVGELVLTHFWPEIEKERYVDEAREVFENTTYAEEGKKLLLKR